MYNIIVVGADESPTALEAVRQAIGFAKMSGGTLHFVTAYKPKPAGTVDVPDEFLFQHSARDGEFLPQTQKLGHQLLPAGVGIFFAGSQSLGLVLDIVKQSDVRQRLRAGDRVAGAGVVVLSTRVRVARNLGDRAAGFASSLSVRYRK